MTQAPEKVHLAAFDYDGTIIDGNSPVLLVTQMAFKRMLRAKPLFGAAWFGIRYKFHLPQTEDHAREMVFTAFEGWPVAAADKYLADFHDNKLQPIYRPQALEAIQRHVSQGDKVVLVSATFEPIARRVMELYPFTHQISTSMKIDKHGLYTCEVDGECTEGQVKMDLLKQWADETYGPDGWELTYAYADHHSDKPMLDAAVNAYAVTPGPTLERYAKKKGWDVLEW